MTRMNAKTLTALVGTAALATSAAAGIAPALNASADQPATEAAASAPPPCPAAS